MKWIYLVASLITATGVITVAVRRWLVGPITHALRDLHVMTMQLRATDALAMELSKLAGAVTNVLIAQESRAAEERSRLDDLVVMAVELQADIARCQRSLAELQMTA